MNPHTLLLAAIILISEVTDYRLAFYISDLLIGVTLVLVLFLEITMVKTGEKTKDSLKKLVSVPSMLALSMIFIIGLLFGVTGYLTIYLQEEMAATPLIFSECRF